MENLTAAERFKAAAVAPTTAASSAGRIPDFPEQCVGKDGL